MNVNDLFHAILNSGRGSGMMRGGGFNNGPMSGK